MIRQTYMLNAFRDFPEGNFTTQVLEEKHPDRILKDHDFLYLLSGSYDIYLDNTKFPLSAGDILLMHAGIRHYGLTHCAPNTQFIWLHIQPAAGDSYNSGTDKPDFPSFSVSLPSMISCHNNPTVKEMLSEIIFSLNSDEHYRETRMNALFNMCLLELNKCAQEQDSPRNELVYDIIHLFQSNPSRNFTLSELSEQFYISSKTINRHFMALYGKTAQSYQHDMKLSAVSKYLTLNPDATIRAAAVNHGFYDEFHLSKCFKKKYGMSPDTYRKLHYEQYKNE